MNELTREEQNEMQKELRLCDHVMVEVTCNCCKEPEEVEMTLVQLHFIQTGAGNIHNILHDHTADTRELFISGICGSCYDRMFAHA